MYTCTHHMTHQLTEITDEKVGGWEFIINNYYIAIDYLYVLCCFAYLPWVFYGHRYTEPDFLFVRSWLPCVFFSGGVTMGNIGRQLAAVSILSLYNLYQPQYYMALYFLSLHLSLFPHCPLLILIPVCCLRFFSDLDGYSLSSSPQPLFYHFFPCPCVSLAVIHLLSVALSPPTL